MSDERDGEVTLWVQLSCLVEELVGMLESGFRTDDHDEEVVALLQRRVSAVRVTEVRDVETTEMSFLARTIKMFYHSQNFSVGVPEINEDQFFEDFSGISQQQAKKRGQINKEVGRHLFTFLKYYTSFLRRFLETFFLRRFLETFS